MGILSYDLVRVDSMIYMAEVFVNILWVWVLFLGAWSWETEQGLTSTVCCKHRRSNIKLELLMLNLDVTRHWVYFQGADEKINMTYRLHIKLISNRQKKPKWKLHKNTNGKDWLQKCHQTPDSRGPWEFARSFRTWKIMGWFSLSLSLSLCLSLSLSLSNLYDNFVCVCPCLCECLCVGMHVYTYVQACESQMTSSVVLCAGSLSSLELSQAGIHMSLCSHIWNYKEVSPCLPFFLHAD